MADTTALKNRIRAAIKANDNQEITGPVLQQTLLDIVDELSDRIIDEYALIGIAVPTTIPPSNLTEYSRVFYLTAQNGIYANLGDIEVSNEIAVIKYNGTSWFKDTVIAIDDIPTAGSNNLVKSGGVVSYINTIGFDQKLSLAKSGSTAGNTLRRYFYGNYKAGDKVLFICTKYDTTGTGTTNLYIKEGDGTDWDNILGSFDNGATGEKTITVSHDCTCLQLVHGTASTITATDVECRVLYGKLKTLYEDNITTERNENGIFYINNIYRHIHINHFVQNKYNIYGDFKAGEKFRLILHSKSVTGSGDTNATIRTPSQFVCATNVVGAVVDGVLENDSDFIVVGTGAASGVTAYEADVTVLYGTSLELMDKFVDDIPFTKVTNYTSHQYYDINGVLREAPTSGSGAEWSTTVIDVNPNYWYLVECCIDTGVRIVDIDGNNNPSVNTSIPEKYYSYARTGYPSFALVKPKYNKLGLTFRDGDIMGNALMTKPKYYAINRSIDSREKNYIDALLETSIESIIRDEPEKKELFIVDFNGGGDYTSLTRAILENADKKGITIRLMPGTYNLFNEFKDYYGNDYFDNYNTNPERGIELKNGITLIGCRNAKIVFNYTGSNTQVMTRFSPFNCNEGGFTMIGINLEASKCRYCVHDERGSNSDVYHSIYKNCNFKLDNSQNDEWSNGMACCIGGGLGVNGSIVIKDCIFEGIRKTGADNRIILYHNSAASGAKSVVVISGNYLKNDGKMVFSCYGQSTEITDISCSNNNMGASILFDHAGVVPEAPNENIVLYEWNNVIRS